MKLFGFHTDFGGVSALGIIDENKFFQTITIPGGPLKVIKICLSNEA